MSEQILITVVGGIITFVFTGIFTAIVTAWATGKRVEIKQENLIFRLTTIEADVKHVKVKQDEYLKQLHEVDNKVVKLEAVRGNGKG